MATPYNPNANDDVLAFYKWITQDLSDWGNKLVIGAFPTGCFIGYDMTNPDHHVYRAYTECYEDSGGANGGRYPAYLHWTNRGLEDRSSSQETNFRNTYTWHTARGGIVCVYHRQHNVWTAVDDAGCASDVCSADDDPDLDDEWSSIPSGKLLSQLYTSGNAYYTAYRAALKNMADEIEWLQNNTNMTICIYRPMALQEQMWFWWWGRGDYTKAIQTYGVELLKYEIDYLCITRGLSSILTMSSISHWIGHNGSNFDPNCFWRICEDTDGLDRIDILGFDNYNLFNWTEGYGNMSASSSVGDSGTWYKWTEYSSSNMRTMEDGNEVAPVWLEHSTYNHVWYNAHCGAPYQIAHDGNMLTWVDTVAEVEATAGTFTVVLDPYTIYVRCTNDENPNGEAWTWQCRSGNHCAYPVGAYLEDTYGKPMWQAEFGFNQTEDIYDWYNNYMKVYYPRYRGCCAWGSYANRYAYQTNIDQFMQDGEVIGLQDLKPDQPKTTGILPLNYSTTEVIPVTLSGSEYFGPYAETRFQIQVTTPTGTFGDIYDSGTVSGTDNYITLTSGTLETYTQYRWRVRYGFTTATPIDTYTGDGATKERWSPWSSAMFFTTTSGAPSGGSPPAADPIPGVSGTEDYRCFGLYEHYDGTNRDHVAFIGGKFFYFDDDNAPVLCEPNYGTTTLGTTGLYDAITFGDWMIFCDNGVHTPHKWTNGESNIYKFITTGTEYKFKYIEEFQQRIIGAYPTSQTNGDLSIHWTDALPTITASGSLSFPAANQLYKPEGNDPITGLKKLGNRLYIYSEKSICRMDYYPDHSTPFGIVTAVANQGCSSHHSIINVGDAHYFFNKNYGFVRYDGGTQLVPISKDIEDQIRGINTGYYNTIIGRYLPLSYEIVWAVPFAGGNTPNHLLFFNVRTGQWSMEDKASRCIDLWKIYESIYRWCELAEEAGGSRSGGTCANDSGTWTNDYWSGIGAQAWMQLTAATERLMLGQDDDEGIGDGYIYYHGGTSIDGEAFSGYRIEPVMDFNMIGQQTILMEIWFDSVYKTNTDLKVWWRGADNPGVFDNEPWQHPDAYASNTNDPATINLSTGPFVIYCNRTARYHQIKWGTEGSAEPFQINGIRFKFIPEESAY